MSRPLRSIPRRAGAIALATSVVLALGASSASAQTLLLRDAHHDVWSGTSADQPADYTAAPKERAADVVHVRLRHGLRNVVFVERFAALRRTGFGNAFSVSLRTNTGLGRVVDVYAFRRPWQGTAMFSALNGRAASCDGLTHQIDYADHLLKVVVPRSCLDNPRWVQFRAENAHISRSERWFYDNPETDTARTRRWSTPVRSD